MNRFVLMLAVMLAACSIPISPTLIQDGNLALTALKALETDAALMGASPADLAAIGLVEGAIQFALADLQKGVKTPADFVTLVNDQISQLAPPLLKDFKASPKVAMGVALLQNLLPVMAAEVMTQPKAAEMVGDPRAKLQAWVDGHK
jgi:hypothetical protein